jgi:hypothetical protein
MAKGGMRKPYEALSDGRLFMHDRLTSFFAFLRRNRAANASLRRKEGPPRPKIDVSTDRQAIDPGQMPRR